MVFITRYQGLESSPSHCPDHGHKYLFHGRVHGLCEPMWSDSGGQGRAKGHCHPCASSAKTRGFHKRRFLLGRKVMPNLDSLFRSRDMTLPTKVRPVKAMVFPVVRYGCEAVSLYGHTGRSITHSLTVSPEEPSCLCPSHLPVFWVCPLVFSLELWWFSRWSEKRSTKSKMSLTVPTQ